MKKLLLLATLATICLTSCTQQERAKDWGGNATIELPKGQKLITCTFKDHDIWYLTRPMTSKDSAESYMFGESSSWGIFQGTVTITESK